MFSEILGDSKIVKGKTFINSVRVSFNFNHLLGISFLVWLNTYILYVAPFIHISFGQQSFTSCKNVLFLLNKFLERKNTISSGYDVFNMNCISVKIAVFSKMYWSIWKEDINLYFNYFSSAACIKILWVQLAILEIKENFEKAVREQLAMKVRKPHNCLNL